MVEMKHRIVFDRDIPGWTDSEKYNLCFIKHVEEYCNDKLRVLGWVSLNDIYDALGYPRTLHAQRVGWMLEGLELNKNNCVKFNILKFGGPDMFIEFENMVDLFYL